MVQLVQVRPPSVERPKPLPTVPYQTELSLGNANEFTKFHEMPGSLPSLAVICCHCRESPGRR